jgi:pimeloyl-ACP methyl ester carboxylesterase
MYYESWGAGRPLVLLHGAISTIEPSFGAVIPRVAQTRRLIAVEQQAHGQTADIERPLTYTQMAEDTATLVRKLKIYHADFFGYSMGAGVALELAVQYPQLVRRLIVASLAYRNDGFHPDTAAQLMETVTGVPSPAPGHRPGRRAVVPELGTPGPRGASSCALAPMQPAQEY